MTQSTQLAMPNATMNRLAQNHFGMLPRPYPRHLTPALQVRTASMVVFGGPLERVVTRRRMFLHPSVFDARTKKTP